MLCVGNTPTILKYVQYVMERSLFYIWLLAFNDPQMVSYKQQGNNDFANGLKEPYNTNLVW